MRRDGFTLVETMVALVVLAMGVLALTHLSVGMAVLMKTAGTKTELIARAENRLEAVQARDYAQLTPGVENDTVVVRGRVYRRRVTITAPSTRLREIQVVVEPLVAGGMTYSTMTYVAR